LSDEDHRTIEDILHQDPREKTERFDSLNYTFVVFRALDESYFRWTASEGSPVLSPASSASPANSKDDLDAKERDEASEEGARQPRRGRVEIVEGVGGKEGVEGVGVGAVNLYLVIFADGLLTFHFEPLPKHTGRVLSKIQQYGLGRPINSSWMAYGLMDSIVDAFFPLVNFIESESKTIDDYLSDPIALEDPTLHRSRPAPRSKRRWQLAQWRMRLLRHLPRVLFFPRRSSADLIAMDDLVLRDRDKLAASHAITPDTDRKVLLLRLAESRKLVTAMSRLLSASRVDDPGTSSKTLRSPEARRRPWPA
jgi:Mg2+ and Co2+ transporter CorA